MRRVRQHTGPAIAVVSCLGLVSCLTQGGVSELKNGGPEGVLDVEATHHLVCWNIHKAADDLFREEVGGVVATIPADKGLLLCLQEVRSTTFEYMSGLHLDEVAGHYAPSWRYPYSKKSTGVLTVSRGWGEPAEAERLLSPNRELWITSPKVSMLSEWAISGGKTLQVVNCHGLNFVSDRVFERQMEQVFSAIVGGTGPALVCGDFNTWSAERLRRLRAQAGRWHRAETEPRPARRVRGAFRGAGRATLTESAPAAAGTHGRRARGRFAASRDRFAAAHRGFAATR